MAKHGQKKANLEMVEVRGNGPASPNPHTEKKILRKSRKTKKEVIEILDKHLIPEKVSGIDRVAEAGLPVPEIRLFIPAAEFEKLNDETLRQIEEQMLAFQQKTSVIDFIVRSAHPDESHFSGGSFESLSITVRPGESRVTIWEKIVEARNKIVEHANPQNSLQVRRDMRYREIDNFDPQKMGVFINEYVPSFILIAGIIPVKCFPMTLVPLANGRFSLRFFKILPAGGYEVHTVEIQENPTQDDVDKVAAGLKSANINCQDVESMLRDIQKAQSIFSLPQEMEIINKYEGGHVFVQSKGVENEEVTDDHIPDELFNQGINTFYYQNKKGDLVEQNLFVEKANQRNEMRDTHALVIDERAWLIEAGLATEYDNENKRKYWTGKFSDISRGAFDIEAAAARDILEKKYKELIEQAEKYPNYTLIIKSVGFSKGFLRECHNRDILHAVGQYRKMLEQCASVQLRGFAEYDSGIYWASTHIKFGVAGPKQISILYQGEHFFHDGGPTSEQREKLINIKNGDRLLVMVRRENNGFKASLLPD